MIIILFPNKTQSSFIRGFHVFSTKEVLFSMEASSFVQSKIIKSSFCQLFRGFHVLSPRPSFGKAHSGVPASQQKVSLKHTQKKERRNNRRKTTEKPPKDDRKNDGNSDRKRWFESHLCPANREYAIVNTHPVPEKRIIVSRTSMMFGVKPIIFPSFSHHFQWETSCGGGLVWFVLTRAAS